MRFSIFPLIVALIRRKRRSKYNSTTLPKRCLQFGDGGGVTGAVVTYTLQPNGRIYKNNSLTEKTEWLKSVKRQEAKLCFEAWKNLKISEISVQAPGNRYYFLGDGKHKIVWGSPQVAVPVEITDLYNMLQKLIKATN